MFSNTFEVLLSYKYAKWLWSWLQDRKGNREGEGDGGQPKTEGSNFQIKFMIDLCNKRGAKRGREREGE